MAARGAALNPTSLPFFPGGVPRSEEDQNQGGGGGDEPKIASSGSRLPSGHVREDLSSSSASDYRSFRSSPSPPYPLRTDSPESTRSRSKEKTDPLHHRRVEDSMGVDSGVECGTGGSDDVDSANNTGITSGDTPIPAHEGAALPPVEEHPSSRVSSGMSGGQLIGILRPLPHPDHQGISNPSSLASNSSFANANLTSSPASSAGESKSLPGFDLLGIEAQLKASPFINDILDRLVRCELSAREIRRELGDVHRKVNLLVDRQFNEPTFRPSDRSLGGNEPTFRNPFTSSTAPITAAAQPMNVPIPYANGGASGNTPSSRSQDEIAQMSQRLNTLTTSVSQLLALQTQQHMQTMNTGFPSTPSLPPNAPPGNLPEQISSPPVPPPSMPGPHALPNRPDLRLPARTPNPPMRTWSAGSLDLPMRPEANIGLGRPEAFLRDKRRSVAGLMRRDSGTVRPTAFYYVEIS